MEILKKLFQRMKMILLKKLKVILFYQEKMKGQKKVKLIKLIFWKIKMSKKMIFLLRKEGENNLRMNLILVNGKKLKLKKKR